MPAWVDSPRAAGVGRAPRHHRDGDRRDSSMRDGAPPRRARLPRASRFGFSTPGPRTTPGTLIWAGIQGPTGRPRAGGLTGQLSASQALPSSRHHAPGKGQRKQGERAGFGNGYLRGYQRSIDEVAGRVLSQDVGERKRRGPLGQRPEVEESQHSVARAPGPGTKERVKHELHRSPLPGFPKEKCRTGARQERPFKPTADELKPRRVEVEVELVIIEIDRCPTRVTSTRISSPRNRLGDATLKIGTAPVPMSPAECPVSEQTQQLLQVLAALFMVNLLRGFDARPRSP